MQKLAVPGAFSHEPPHSTSSSAIHRYKTVRVIGQGSFGSALLVHDAEGRQRVMKTVNFANLSRKRRRKVHHEAELMKCLHHPFIVRFRENFVDTTMLYIVMDFASSGDLRKQVHEAKQSQLAVPEDKLVRWVTQACLGLDYVHSLHILHRDLKSENLFLDTMDHLRIGDFGIACTLRQPATIVVENNLVGTPYYLSPEICTMGVHSKASDMWALGCVLFELAALTVPFHGTDLPSLIEEITTKPAPKLPIMYSVELADMYASLMCRSRTMRPLTREVLRCVPIRQMVYLLKPLLKDSGSRKPYVADFEYRNPSVSTHVPQANFECCDMPSASSSRCHQDGAKRQSKLEPAPEPELCADEGSATCCPTQPQIGVMSSIHNSTSPEVPAGENCPFSVAQNMQCTPKVAVGAPVQRLRELKRQRSCTGLPYPASSLLQPAAPPPFPPPPLPLQTQQASCKSHDHMPETSSNPCHLLDIAQAENVRENFAIAAACEPKQEDQANIARLSATKERQEVSAPPAWSSQLVSSIPDKCRMRPASASSCIAGEACSRRPRDLPPLNLEPLSRCKPAAGETRQAVPHLKGLESARSMSLAALSSARQLCRALSWRDRAHSERCLTESSTRRDSRMEQQARLQSGWLSSRLRQPFRHVAGALPSFAFLAMPLTQRRQCHIDLPRPGRVQTSQTSRSSSVPSTSRLAQ